MQVLYHPSGDVDKRTALITVDSQILINGLQPSTEYGIEVVAITEAIDKFEAVGEVVILTEPGTHPYIDM